MATKHKGTSSPWQCAHCGLIWYGHQGSDSKFREAVLCTKCHNAFVNAVYQPESFSGDDEQQVKHYPERAAAWISDPTKKPFPRVGEKRYNSSVPKWMRSAIDQGMVLPNDNYLYVVYSEGDYAVKVEKTEKSFEKQGT